ncbi:MAG: ribosome-associated translation inhibitor RaiA [Deltaproteobacteria bacterium]|nr:MAG: ribosome-associated translation inhibitor RaiA [Deltaproteobacteria bacterium]
MHTHFTFRHMEPSDAVRAYAEERLQKIRRYFADPIKIDAVFTLEHKRFTAEFDIVLRNGIQLHASESTENMYSSIDLALAKLERQVRRYKSKLKEHRPRADESMRAKVAVLEEAVEPEAPVEEAAKPPAYRVVRTREMSVRSFTVDEAIMQMNLLDDQFIVFNNADTGEVCVVYRRDDGTYGLIETGARVVRDTSKP